MEQIPFVDIQEIIDRTQRPKALYSNIPEPIVLLNKTISWIIEANIVCITEFVVAKIKGFIPDLDGHTEITEEIFIKIPLNLNTPKKILRDTRAPSTYLFICENPLHEIVVEVNRYPRGKTEINTIHLIKNEELKRLERKFPVVYSSSAETPMSSDTFDP